MFASPAQQLTFDLQDRRSLVEQLESLYESDLYAISRDQELLESSKNAADNGSSGFRNVSSKSSLFHERLRDFANLFKKNNDDESLFQISDTLKDDPALGSVMLNILIEQSISDYFLSHKDSKLMLMSLAELDDLKIEIAELEEEKRRLTNNDTLAKIDTKLLGLQTKLNNHYFVCSQLGYIQDVLDNSNSTRNITSSKLNKRRSMILNNPLSDPSMVNDSSSSNIERSLEELVSQVMSLSVKHNVNLVEPNVDMMYTLGGRIDWVTSCIKSLVEGRRSNQSSTPSSSADNTRSVDSYTAETSMTSTSIQADDKDKLIEELETKLNDLQFAHTYLTRRFEDEREQYDRSLNKNRLKLQSLHESISKSNFEVSNQTSALLKNQTKINELEKALNSKDKEILDLNKEINILKVDTLGLSHSGQSTSPRTSYDAAPKTPDMPSDFTQQQQQHDSSPNRDKNVTSVSILRMEFKKIVTKMNEKHESQLEAERTERKRLENLLKMYESGNITGTSSS